MNVDTSLDSGALTKSVVKAGVSDEAIDVSSLEGARRSICSLMRTLAESRWIYSVERLQETI